MKFAYLPVVGSAESSGDLGLTIAGTIIGVTSDNTFRRLASAGDARWLDLHEATERVTLAIAEGNVQVGQYVDGLERAAAGIDKLVTDAEGVAANPADLAEDVATIEGYIARCRSVLAGSAPSDGTVMAARIAQRAHAAGQLKDLEQLAVDRVLGALAVLDDRADAARSKIEADLIKIEAALHELRTTGADRLSKLKVNQKLRRVAPQAVEKLNIAATAMAASLAALQAEIGLLQDATR